jgi:O-antigen ligase
MTGRSARVTCFVILSSIFLLPGIDPGAGLPTFRLEDVAVLLLILAGARRLEYPLATNRYLNGYLIFLGFSTLWMFVCLLGNGRLAALSDYFELYKMTKYVTLLFLGYIVASRGSTDAEGPLLWVLLALLLIFNLANYLDLAGFNRLVMPWYASAERIVSFGKDSMGNPATRRILGTMGNPNDNGVLWTFVAAYFLSRSGSRMYHFPFFLAAMAMTVLSGSRTAFVGILVVLAVFWIMGNRSATRLLQALTFVLFAVALVLVLNIQYISALWTTDLMENPSWLARLEVWEYLRGMISQSPLIGYGPNKEFFYNHNLYSENEYLLMAWRYGFLGLAMYLGIFLIPAVQAWRSRVSASSRMVVIMSVAMAVSALTNNPFSEPRLMALYALAAGAFYGHLNRDRGTS